MITLDCIQGSAEWHFARLGLPTASQFHRILIPKTRKISASSEKYMHELLAEWIIGMPTGASANAFMQRGTQMEAEAVSFYEFTRDVKVQRVGFVTRDDKLVGASPDGLLGADGGLEIKCPSAVTHVANMLDMTDDHWAQAQGGMYVTDRKWWDVLSYNPEMPSVVLRYQRDDTYIDALHLALRDFLVNLLAARQKLRERGCIEATVLDPEFAASLQTPKAA